MAATSRLLRLAAPRPRRDDAARARRPRPASAGEPHDGGEVASEQRRHDADLARQAYRALATVPLNVAEASGRAGRDRVHLFRIALGSLRELGAALDLAAAFGWPPDAPCAAERDRLCGMLYGLQR